MFRHCGEDVVAGRPGSIRVREGKIPPLPIPLFPHLTDTEAGIFDTAECLSGLTQGVGLSPLHVEVQEPEGLYLVKDKVKARHGENCRSHLDLLLLLCILPVFTFFPLFAFWRTRVIVQFGRRVLLLTLTVEVESYSPPAPPPSSRSFAATRSSYSYDPPPFLLWSPPPLEERGHKS